MKINEKLEKYLMFTILILIITIVLMTVWVYNENLRYYKPDEYYDNQNIELMGSSCNA